MEFKVYDAAFAKQHNKHNINGMPLVSWDIYMQFLFQTNVLINDVNSLNQIATKNQWKSVWDFKENLQDKTVIVVTDAHLKIVFATKNIKKMNGYSASEVVGNSPKMFQGEQTDLQVSNEIRQAIINKVPFEKNHPHILILLLIYPVGITLFLPHFDCVFLLIIYRLEFQIKVD